MVDKKNINIELLRFMATVAVILIHMSMSHYHDAALMKENAGAWYVNQLYNTLSRFCVPVFFIVTAYLCFNNHSFKRWDKKIIRLGIPWLAWSCLYYFIQGGRDIIELLKQTLTANTSFHLWFIPPFIGYIIFLPVITQAFSGENREKLRFIFISVFCFTICVPAIIDFLNLYFANINYLRGLAQFGLIFPSFLVYALAFPYLHKKMTPGWGLLSYFIIILINIIPNAIVSYKRGIPNETFYVFTSPLIFISSYILFNVIMSLNISELPEPLKKFIYNAGECSFGIYLSHWFVFLTLNRTGIILHEHTIIDPLVNTVIVFAASFIFIYLLRKIKPARIFV